MRVARIECWPVRAPYSHPELSSLVVRDGVTDIMVKLTTDDGLVGWGESTRCADAAGIADAVRAMTPIVLGRDPWDRDAIARDIKIAGCWQFQAMTANFAYAGVDMALWDLCGRAVGQPLYRLFGGAVRDEVDYFYYLHWGAPDQIAAQGREGRKRGYTVFYLKVGVDGAAEEAMLEALRDAIGPDAKIRIDVNQSWSVAQAVATLRRWHKRFTIDFVEAPVPIHPESLTLDVKARQPVSVCVNEGLWTAHDAMRVIESRCGDTVCFSPYWVGSIQTYLTLCRVAAHHGWLVCKHTHGELGLTAALGQHLMLAVANAGDGHQQTAQFMAEDVLAEPIPIADGPRWGRIAGAGLGVSVDEDKVRALHEDYRAHGEYPVYGDRFGGA